MGSETSHSAYLKALPCDWTIEPISAIAKVVGGGTPSRDVAAYWNGVIPWVTPSEVSREESIFLADTREHISAAGLAGSGATLLPIGSLMITTRATLGARAISATPMTTNQGFKSLVFSDPSDAPFYFYVASKLKPELTRRASGTTFLEVSGSEVGDIRVPVPPKGERTLIAQVLDTVDTTIRQTEAIIAKLKQVKQGLLHDLLTRGIDAHGELRPPQSEAPDLYKASPLGWIPHDWRVDTLAALSVGGLMNGVFKEPRRVGRGVALVNVADLYRGEKIDLESCERFAATAVEIDRFGVAKGDIFFTRSSLKLDGIAQTSIVEVDPNDAVFECHVMRLRPAARITVPRYLKEWCVARHARSHFMSHAKQVTMTTISQDGINTLLCPVPPIEEQAEAIRRVIGIDARISAEEQNLHKAQLLKSGLMDDLLTGRVRVTPLLAQAPATQP